MVTRTPTSTLVRQATRTSDEPLNILSCSTHESYESSLAETGQCFYDLEAPGGKHWNRLYREVPPNFQLFGNNRPDWVLPEGVDFDIVLVQNKMAHWPILAPIANVLQIPIVCLEHTARYPSFTPEYLSWMKSMSGAENVFISESSRKAWGYDESNSCVVEHGICDRTFKPSEGPRKLSCLSVVNQWKERDAPCGYNFWVAATRGLPCTVLGDNPGLSEPAPSLAGLASAYADHAIFVNTSLISPIPTALLEAMMSGCICISTATCEIPNIITHGQTGILCESPAEMREWIKQVLANPHSFAHLGQNARAYAQKRFGLRRFAEEWNQVFKRAAATPFLRRYPC